MIWGGPVKTRVLWCALFLACWLTLVLAEPTRTFAIWNLAVQLAIFIPTACVPAWRTGWMSYVDFAWPCGLAAVGVQTFLFAEALTPLTLIAGAFYTLVGMRMSIWGLHLYKPGWLTAELPRYQYQRRRWERAGFRSERLSVQYEIMVQAMANASFLALPALLISTNSSPRLGAVEYAAIALGVMACGFESLADLQKRRFLGGYTTDSREICDVGLWRHSRHPNYFGQWVQWVALVTLAAPSTMDLHGRTPLPALLLLSLALLWVARMMYSTMVHYTGAVPAEYYSVRKRPAYAQYQATVNRFFPGPRSSEAPAPQP
ncbi:DUF1295 domain-containing protein [Streptomyces qinglanensis]|uniref:DUF1295 domain-containing protein n=1 Tax=Streptomyces qinglanensis TaxID=943816 RepID=UPI003D725361